MKIENASISWLTSGLPYSNKYRDVYYSEEDELAESQHVFLNANKLGQRWALEKDADNFHIAEIGFGSGLNFLQVSKLWKKSRQRPTRLHYLGFEKYPLTKTQMQSIHERWPGLIDLSETLLSQYTDHSRGCHRLILEQGITLDLYFGDGFEQLNSRLWESCPAIQCWFLDGFTPANNPELWNEKLMQLIAGSSNEETTLSSYSVAGKVRAALINSGFEVEKLDGYGRKRHMLFARKMSTREDSDKQRYEPSNNKPWFRLPQIKNTGKTAAIIGAGLAGSSTAYSLVQRGWNVEVFDSGSRIAPAASGNALLALRCRLFNAESEEAEFFLHCYLFALRQFKMLKKKCAIPWNECGVLQLHNALNRRSPLRAEKLNELYSEQIVNLLSKANASAASRAPLVDAALHFPSGGCIPATSLCESYLKQANIKLHLNSTVTDFSKENQSWSLQIGNAKTVQADIVVIANSYRAVQFAQSKKLPLQALRGQTTETISNKASDKLRATICGERTVFPATNGRHLVSASYSKNTGMQSSTVDNISNLRIASANFDDEGFIERNPIAARVSLRCNSPDRLPIVGMMPDLTAMRTSYRILARNAKASTQTAGQYLPGLYINVAHGSNGLASCPLCAELLASMIHGENLPIGQAAINKLNPSRFLIRELQKQKP